MYLLENTVTLWEQSGLSVSISPKIKTLDL